MKHFSGGGLLTALWFDGLAVAVSSGEEDARDFWQLRYPPWDESASESVADARAKVGERARPRLVLPILGPLTRHSCFPSRYLAMRIAVSNVNQRNAIFCPAIAVLEHDFEIEYMIMDTHDDDAVTTGLILHNFLAAPPTVVLGPDSSAESMAAYTALRAVWPSVNIPQVSWAATASELSNKLRYPNFFRLASPASHITGALVTFVETLAYKRAHVFFFEFRAQRASEFMMASSKAGLQTTGHLMPSRGASGQHDLFESAVGGILRNVEVAESTTGRGRVVVVDADDDEACALWGAAMDLDLLRSRGWLWVATDAAPNSLDCNADPDSATAFVGLVYATVNGGDGTRFATFAQQWALRVHETQLPEFSSMPICHGGTSCAKHSEFEWKDEVHGANLICTNYVAFAYDAIVLLAVAYDRILATGVPQESISSAHWLRELRNFSHPANGIECLSGHILLDGNQEQLLPVYLMNVRGTSPTDRQNFIAMKQHAGDLVWNVGVEMIWPSGVRTAITNRTLPAIANCSEGYVFSAELLECHPCPADAVILGDECVCNAGFARQGDWYTDGLRCLACPPGRFKASAGHEVCEKCSRGRYMPISGSAQCALCPSNAECDTGPDGEANGAVAFQSAANFYVVGNFKDLIRAFELEQLEHKLPDGFDSRFKFAREGLNEIGPLKCPVKHSCTGNNACILSADGTRPAMQGPLCAACAPGFYRGSVEDLCGECPPLWRNIIFYILGAIAFFLAILIVDYLNERTVQNKKRTGEAREVRNPQVRDVVPKILNNFCVLLISMSDVLELEKFAGEVSSDGFFHRIAMLPLLGSLFVGKAMTTPSRSITALECMMHQLGGFSIKAQYGSELYGWLLIPMSALWIWASLFIYYSCRRKHSVLKETETKFRPLLIVMVYFLHPMATSELASVFQCNDYDQYTRLRYDAPRLRMNMQINCKSSEHIRWQAVSVVGLFFWSLGIPVVLGGVLWCLKSDRSTTLQSEAVLRKYGFLYNGFQSDCYYYEIVYMLRKVFYLFTACLPLGLSTLKTLLLVCNLIFFSMHLAYRPFDDREYGKLDQIEFSSCFTLLAFLLANVICDLLALDMKDRGGTWLTTRIVYTPAIIGLFDLIRRSVYATLRPLIWPLYGPAKLPSWIRNRWDHRLRITLKARDDTKSKHDGHDVQDIALTHLSDLDQTGQIIKKLPEAERELLKLIFTETLEVLLQRHEHRIGSAPITICLPRLLLQLERVLACCFCMALRSRVNGLMSQRKHRTWSMLVSSVAKNSKEKLRRSISFIRAFFDKLHPSSGVSATTGTPTKKKGRGSREKKSLRRSSIDEEVIAVVSQPVSAEEIRVALSTLTPQLLDHDNLKGEGDFLYETMQEELAEDWCKSNRELLDQVCHASVLFEPSMIWMSEALRSVMHASFMRKADGATETRTSEQMLATCSVNSLGDMNSYNLLRGLLRHSAVLDLPEGEQDTCDAGLVVELSQRLGCASTLKELLKEDTEPVADDLWERMQEAAFEGSTMMAL